MALHEEVRKILALEMGPAADAFLERNCRVRLSKEVNQIEKTDLKTLSFWVKVGAKIALGEETAVKLESKVLALA